jgi:hypothetical protein
MPNHAGGFYGDKMSKVTHKGSNIEGPLRTPFGTVYMPTPVCDPSFDFPVNAELRPTGDWRISAIWDIVDCPDCLRLKDMK